MAAHQAVGFWPHAHGQRLDHHLGRAGLALQVSGRVQTRGPDVQHRRPIAGQHCDRGQRDGTHGGRSSWPRAPLSSRFFYHARPIVHINEATTDGERRLLVERRRQDDVRFIYFLFYAREQIIFELSGGGGISEAGNRKHRDNRPRLY